MSHGTMGEVLTWRWVFDVASVVWAAAALGDPAVAAGGAALEVAPAAVQSGHRFRHLGPGQNALAAHVRRVVFVRLAQRTHVVALGLPTRRGCAHRRSPWRRALAMGDSCGGRGPVPRPRDAARTRSAAGSNALTARCAQGLAATGVLRPGRPAEASVRHTDRSGAAEQQAHLASRVGLKSGRVSPIVELAVRRQASPFKRFGIGRAWQAPTTPFSTSNPHPTPTQPPTLETGQSSPAEHTLGEAKAGWAHAQATYRHAGGVGARPDCCEQGPAAQSDGPCGQNNRRASESVHCECGGWSWLHPRHVWFALALYRSQVGLHQ